MVTGLGQHTVAAALLAGDIAARRIHHEAFHRFFSKRAQWYIACGDGRLHLVMVRVDQGRVPLRVFFSTDPTMSDRDVLETHAGRWSIEVTLLVHARGKPLLRGRLARRPSRPHDRGF